MMGINQFTAPREGPCGITKTEAECLDWALWCGKIAPAAEKLGKSVKTVDAQVASVKKKMGVKSTMHALILWNDYRRDKPSSVWGGL